MERPEITPEKKSIINEWFKKSRTEWIQAILEITKYRDGDYYMGSMAHASLCRVLDISYPSDYEKKLKTVPDHNLKKAIVYLVRYEYLQHMLEHPVMNCPICGSTHRVNYLQPEIDSFTKLLKGIFLKNVKELIGRINK